MFVQVTPEELGRALEGPQPPRVVDVRNPEEYEKRHLKGSISIPLRRLSQEIARKIPNKNEPVVLYCDLGIRSHHAARLLRAMGYNNVKEMVGGMHGLGRASMLWANT